MAKIKILDHGFIELLNLSGPINRPSVYKDIENGITEFSARDIDPAITARMSFDNFEQDRTKAQDLKLLKYLMVNQHSTPLEMITSWWRIKLPIFVARQFHRHRMQSINEMSGRYTTLPAEWYIPEIVGGKSSSNKQGQEDNLAPLLQEEFRQKLDSICRLSYEHYLTYLAKGVAPEHARMFLHVNNYTEYVFKIDIHNMLHFLSLRLHPHAQIEARKYAETFHFELSKHLPEIMKNFDARNNL
jgi:thymidylate synthase (FAD)